MTDTSFNDYDHHRCISDALNFVALYYNENGLRLTEQRRQVLEILLSEHKAIGAYEILAQLKATGINAKPPVAYIACAHPGQDHAPAFMICRMCDKLAETRAARVSSA